MTARVCGGVPSPLIEPIVGRERKGLTVGPQPTPNIIIENKGPQRERASRMGSRKREEPTRKPERERIRYAKARLNTCGLIKFIMKEKTEKITPRARALGNVSWRDEDLTWCSETRHPSSLLIEGAGRARVSAPPAP